MNVLFLHQGIEEPSTRYRIYSWKRYLTQEQIVWEEYPQRLKLYPNLPSPLQKRKNYVYLFSALRRILMAQHYDVVFMQKFFFPATFSWLDHFIYKLPNVVLDLPDAIFCLPHNDTPFYENKLRALCKAVKSVMVSNKFMYDWVGIPEKTIIMPTVLEMANIPERRYSQNKEKIIIGWNGQKYQLPLIEPLFDVLKEVSTLPNVEIRFMTSTIEDTTTLNKFGIQIVPFDGSREFEMLQDIDIGLMPMDQSLFSMGKFSLKLIQYMASGAAVVCSPVGSNTEIVDDGINGYYANNPQEWYQRIHDLIHAPEKRMALGKAGRKKVEQHYSTSANWNTFHAALLQAAS